MRRKIVGAFLLATTMLALTGCSQTYKQDVNQSNGDRNVYYYEVHAKDGTTIPCVVYWNRAVTCDWSAR